MNEQPTEQHQPVSDATRVDLEPTPEKVAADNYYDPGFAYRSRALRNGDSVTVSTRAQIRDSITGGYTPLSPVVAATAEKLVDQELQRRSADVPDPAPDYSDVESTVLRSIETAEMLASLRVSGEQIDPAATEATVARIRDLRLALGGVGQVGQHFNAVGTPVGDQVAIILTANEVATLIMRLTGKVRFETI